MEETHRRSPFGLVIMLGDNIYENGDQGDIVTKFERPYANLLSRGVRFQASLGNHDVRRGREAEIAYPGFNMNGRSYYSFSRGDGLADFFAIDSTRFDEQQSRWLRDSLASSTARWKIAFLHHSIYSSAAAHGKDDDIIELRARLEPILVAGKVSVVFSGHDHTYERTHPQKGIQYFVSGAAGKLRKGDLDRHSPFLAAGHDQSQSFMLLELDRKSLRFWSIDISGKVVDSGSLRPRK